MQDPLEGGMTLIRQFLSAQDSPQRGLTAEGHLLKALPSNGGTALLFPRGDLVVCHTDYYEGLGENEKAS